jgi:hypothetical protein
MVSYIIEAHRALRKSSFQSAIHGRPGKVNVAGGMSTASSLSAINVNGRKYPTRRTTIPKYCWQRHAQGPPSGIQSDAGSDARRRAVPSRVHNTIQGGCHCQSMRAFMTLQLLGGGCGHDATARRSPRYIALDPLLGSSVDGD